MWRIGNPTHSYGSFTRLVVGSGSGARDSNGPAGLHSSGTTTPWRVRTFTILGHRMSEGGNPG
jgi:hypothetical protein